MLGVVPSVVAADTAKVKVSDFGYDAVDATVIVQKALDSGARQVVFDVAPGAWTVGPVYVRSDTEILFEEGAQLLAKPGEFLPLKSALLNVIGATNVTVRGLGKGATLRMRIADYRNPPYEKGEWRHTVNLLSVKNVLVENLLLADSGGDGVYLGVKCRGCPNENVTIRRCVCDNNNRQGISVISAKHLLIEDTVMKNTRGTSPKSGIDFEPNDASEVLIDCVMRNCLTAGNDGAGYEMYFGQLSEATAPISITLENCRSEGDRRGALVLAFDPQRHGRGQPRGGFLKVKGCTFLDSPLPAVSIYDKPEGVMDATFEDCVFENCATASSTVADVHLGRRTLASPGPGGISFHNVRIVRKKKGEEWMYVSRRPWRRTNATAISGDVVVCADGMCERIVLDDGWRKTHLDTDRSERYVLDPVCFNPSRTRVVDNAPGVSVKLSPLKVRFGCDARIYAAKPGPVAFAVRMSKVGRKNPPDGRFFVTDMTGRNVAVLPAPDLQPSVRTFTAPQTGFYRVVCNVRPHALVFSECDAPMGLLSTEKAPLDIFASQGAAYFTHEAGTDATLFCCGGSAERVTARLVNPDSVEVHVWKDMGEWGFHRIPPDGPTGVWRVELARPNSAFTWEDSFLRMAGAPSVFFLSPDKCWFNTRPQVGNDLFNKQQ